ncbi:MAG: iron ABC transporter permease [Chloroflexi bacterium HGW-Chloroflexi-1]|nr:MAG: iron ABC transporter permease [Chloroflexi bacterium HGW-Chloroflexi-1]
MRLPRREEISVSYLVLGAAILVLVILVAWPMLLLFVNTVIVDSEFTTRLWREVFTRRQNYTALRNTLYIGVLVTLGSTVIGSFFAWLVGRTDLPFKGALKALLMLPFLMPPFIGAIAWETLLSPRSGYFNKAFMSLFHTTTPLLDVFSTWGIVMVESIYFYPFVFITVAGALERMDPTLEEAARTAGAGMLKVMKDVTLPLVSPSIMAGALLAFAASISNFGIPLFLGMEKGFFVLTTRIFIYIKTQSASFEGLQLGATLSVFLLLASGTAIILEGRLLGGRKYAILAGKSMRPHIVELGRWKPVFLALCLVFLFVAVLAPIGSIYLVSLLKVYGQPVRWENLTLNNYYHELFKDSMIRGALRNSLVLSVAAATIVMIVGSVIAYVLVKTRIKGRKVVEFFVMLPYSIPGTVVAIAMLLAWTGKYGPNLYGTLWLILAAYCAHFMALGVKSAAASLEQVHTSLEEAARVSGANWLKTFGDIVAPLIKPGLVAGWLLVFIPAFRELTTSVLLVSTHTMTIGVAIYNRLEDGYFLLATAMSGIILLLVFVGNLVITRVTR